MEEVPPQRSITTNEIIIADPRIGYSSPNKFPSFPDGFEDK